MENVECIDRANAGSNTVTAHFLHASSAEFVGKYRFRQITKCIIQGCLQAIK